jgi:hypothetical protein
VLDSPRGALRRHHPETPSPRRPGAPQENPVLQKFQALLHQYKKEVFHAEHDKKSLEDITAEALHVTEDVLQQKYSYHFHQLPDASRADIINMINNYTREAILPPLVESLVRRQMIQDRKIEALVHLLESLLESLSVGQKDD